MDKERSYILSLNEKILIAGLSEDVPALAKMKVYVCVSHFLTLKKSVLTSLLKCSNWC